jgi:hypothetical protein
MYCYENENENENAIEGWVLNGATQWAANPGRSESSYVGGVQLSDSKITPHSSHLYTSHRSLPSTPMLSMEYDPAHFAH